MFLIRRNLIMFEQLERVALIALARASEFDMNSEDVKAHLQSVRELLK